LTFAAIKLTFNRTAMSQKKAKKSSTGLAKKKGEESAGKVRFSCLELELRNWNVWQASVSCFGGNNRGDPEHNPNFLRDSGVETLFSQVPEIRKLQGRSGCGN
jgi:hypothetical protein